MADVREVEGVREESLKLRLNTLDKGLRDITRGVQLIRDKQVRTPQVLLWDTCHSTESLR